MIKIINLRTYNQKYDGHDVNGSEKNPAGSTTIQGCDSQLGNYDETLNVGLYVSGTSPITLVEKDVFDCSQTIIRRSW